MLRIKTITPQQTHAVRQPVLRPGLPESSCIFPGDELATTTHLGIYDGDKLAGILSLFENTNNLFEAEKQFQIRGMAVLPEYQKKGLGEKLMEEAEQHARNNNAALVWCNARKSATGFYKKTGYRSTGSPFDIPGVGIHYVMYKHL